MQRYLIVSVICIVTAILIMATTAWPAGPYSMVSAYSKTVSGTNEIRVRDDGSKATVLRALWRYEGEENGKRFIRYEGLRGFYFVEEATMLEGLWPWCGTGQRCTLTNAELQKLLGRDLEAKPIHKEILEIHTK
jgi:hypothetical protein